MKSGGRPLRKARSATRAEFVNDRHSALNRTHVARHPWITRESNTVRAPYQRVQGDQPVVILWRGQSQPQRGMRKTSFSM